MAARIFVLNEPYALRISPALAREIGLNESIVLLQLEFLITISNTKEIDGNIWTYQSLTDLRESYFPFWSLSTINRIMRKLEREGYIKIGNYNKLGYDRTQWYSLDEAGIARLNSIHIDKSILQNEKWNRSNCKMEPVKMTNGSSQNDTTIPETPTETPTETPEEEGDSFPFRTAPPVPHTVYPADPARGILEGVLFPLTPKAVDYFATVAGASLAYGQDETAAALNIALADWKETKGSNGRTYNPHNYGWIEWGINYLAAGNKKTWKDPNNGHKKTTPTYTESDRELAARIRAGNVGR